MKNSIRLGLVFAAIAGVVSVGCAKGSNIGDGAGGFGGYGGASGTGGSADGPATSTGSGQGGASGTGTASSSAASGSPAGSTTTSGNGAVSSSSAAGSTGSGLMCPPPEHFCNGVCANNTPDTGCTTSVTCTPCPAPVNGTATCSAAGMCDFTCTSPYVKSGASCVCGAACCSNADCGGNGATCVNGTCMAPPSCDQAACSASCIAMCLPQGKLGVGACLNNMCVCVCT